MLDELEGDVEHGRIRNQQGPSVAGVMSEITTQTTRGPVLSQPAHQAISSSRHRMKEVPYVVLRDVLSPSYGSSTQGHRVWFKKLCRLWLSVIGRPAPHDDSAAN